MKTVRIIAAILITAAVLCLGNGCTVIGYGLGSVADSSIRKTVTVAPLQAVDRLRTNEDVTLYFPGGGILEGRFLGWSSELRGTQIDTAALSAGAPPRDNGNADSLAVLRKGDTLTLHFTTGHDFGATYESADREQLYYTRREVSGVQHVALERIARITLSGGMELMPPLDRYVFPTRGESTWKLLLQVDGRVTGVPLTDITSIGWHESGTLNRAIFTATGAAVDVVLIISYLATRAMVDGIREIDWR